MTSPTMILFPVDPMVALLGGKPAVDQHFDEEYRWAVEAGKSVGLYNHDALELGEDFKVLKHASVAGHKVLIRGYMLPVDKYQRLEALVRAANGNLLTNSETYQRLHHLPGWYHLVPQELTAQTVWGVQTAYPDLSTLPEGSGFVKDYVKSLKHLPQATKIDNVRDELAASEVLDLFVRERDVDLQGGLVVRQWQQLEDVQWRTWWNYERLIAATCHPDHDGIVPDVQPPTELIVETMKALRSPFATADFARDNHGRWQIVEIGDGQVSDRPRSIAPEILLSPL